MRQVHDLHDAINHGHADGHGGIDACQQQGLQQKVEILRSTHVNGSAYLFGIGATGSPVAASFGKTMSTLLSGLFCVITKGYSAWPLAANFSFCPGSTESFNSAFFSASRIAVLSSDPAFSMACAAM